MSSSRPTHRKRSPGPGKRWAEWALVRGWMTIYALVADWLTACAPGRLRTHWLRVINRDIGKLEQILRCLLLIMRPPRAAPRSPVSAFTSTASGRAARTHRASARFSVTLRKFSWYTPLPQSAPQSVAGSSPRVRQLAEDPAAALQRRLAAMRAVFADPAPHARRIADACLARGLRPNRPKSIFPDAELWQFVHAAMPARAASNPAARLDSS